MQADNFLNRTAFLPCNELQVFAIIIDRNRDEFFFVSQWLVIHGINMLGDNRFYLVGCLMRTGMSLPDQQRVVEYSQ